jgi:myo-inositol-1(or 4)-monophosphatase
MSTDIEPAVLARWTAGARIVSGARDLFRGSFGRVASEWKHDGSRVTSADLAVTEHILTALSAGFPEDQCFSEEGDPRHGAIPIRSRFCWILDPVDGTNNYALGVPFCAISLALLENGRPVAGFIYDYARDSILRGGPAFGAFDGDRACRPLSEKLDVQSVIAVNVPWDPIRVKEVVPVFQRHKIRCLGASTLHLAYVAAGLLHGTLDHNVKVWDIAAACAILEAGGGEFRPLDAPVFPLTKFDVSMDRIRFVAGVPAVCDVLEGYIREGEATPSLPPILS